MIDEERGKKGEALEKGINIKEDGNDPARVFGHSSCVCVCVCVCVFECVSDFLEGNFRTEITLHVCLVIHHEACV